MNALIERPSIQEVDRLAELAATPTPDRAEMPRILRHIEDGLRERGRELDRAGGLLDEEEKAARMSLAREDDRLRDESSDLLQMIESIRMALPDLDDAELHRRISALVAGLRGHRDAEASLVLESVDTEVGAGD